MLLTSSSLNNGHDNNCYRWDDDVVFKNCAKIEQKEKVSFLSLTVAIIHTLVFNWGCPCN